MSNYEAHAWLERYYHYLLMYAEDGKRAKEYLFKRGITEKTITDFRLGFAPESSSLTIKFLLSKGFRMRNLLKWKVLYRQRKGNVSDLFRGRVVIPIRDFSGRTVAFGGRSVNKIEKIKYFNSPETEIYVKGDNLFGFEVAKEYVDKSGYIVLMEGFFDVLMAHQENVKNTVGTLGTSLTVNQALLIKSITDKVVIAFDGDDAGVENAFRSARILKSVGCKVKIGMIPKGIDPDDYMKGNGGTSFQGEVINTSLKYEDALLAHLQTKHDLSSVTGRFMFTNEVLNGVSTNDVSAKEKLLMKIGDTLGISLIELDKKLS